MGMAVHGAGARRSRKEIGVRRSETVAAEAVDR
jgi:hypothetical protein